MVCSAAAAAAAAVAYTELCINTNRFDHSWKDTPKCIHYYNIRIIIKYYSMPQYYIL